jgi:hypothetical protein
VELARFGGAKELQGLLGQSSLAMTMRYAHLAPERPRSAVTRLEGLTSSKPAVEEISVCHRRP